ncbi:unnamed protein product [Withania somnifera]
MLATFLIICSSATGLEKFDHPIKENDNLSFLVIGDYNQSAVAFQMGRIGEELDIDFVVSTGDNFFIIMVLGNHDYRGDAEAQLSPYLRKIDSRWICLRSFIINAEIAEIFMVDTTPFVREYFIETEHTYDWRNVMPQKTYTEHVLKSKMEIVVGHHTIRSVGHHGDTNELAYDVDLYMNGHDHCLEHISDSESAVQFLTSKAWRRDVKSLNREGMKFFYDGQGFMSVQLTPTHVDIQFYDVFAKVLHKWSRSKQLLHTII